MDLFPRPVDGGNRNEEIKTPGNKIGAKNNRPVGVVRGSKAINCCRVPTDYLTAR